MALTTPQVRGFKSKDKPYKKGDKRCLYLFVKPNGSYDLPRSEWPKICLSFCHD